MARRRFGRPGTTRIVFSVLWIALGGLSAYYLFTLFTGAAPAVSRTAQMAAPAAPELAAQAPSPSVEARTVGRAARRDRQKSANALSAAGHAG